LGPRSRPTHMYTRARWIYGHPAEISKNTFRENIPNPFRNPIHTY
jgi:hypothetical protein